MIRSDELIERLRLHSTWRDSHGELNDAPNEAREMLEALTRSNDEPTEVTEVERLAPLEELLIEAYGRGWREGCETVIEDYPDAMIAVPHKDAMSEGCGDFMTEAYQKLRAAINAMRSVS